MNLNPNDIWQENASLDVSIPIRDLMNLNPVWEQEDDAKFSSFNPY